MFFEYCFGRAPFGVGLSVTSLRFGLSLSLQTAPVGRITTIPHAGEVRTKSYGFGQKILAYFGLLDCRITPVPHAGLVLFLNVTAK